MHRLIRRLQHLIGRGRFEADISEEIEVHRAMEQTRLEQSGVPPAQAYYASRRALGNVALAREDASSVWGWPSLERLWQDVRYGARMLRRNWGFTSIAIVTLALGIGANTAMFSVVNGVLLRPLPYADPDRLVMVWAADAQRNIHEAGTSYPTYSDWRSQTRHFEDMAIWTRAAIRLRIGAESERVSSAFVSANLFPLLGVSPTIGRTFSPDEERQRERVVVLSHGLWKRQFGTDPGVLNQTLEFDAEPTQGLAERVPGARIIGVMPEGFFFPTPDVQFWRPSTLLNVDGKPKLYERQWTDRFIDRWRVVARLGPGVTIPDAQTHLTIVGRRLADAFPVQRGFGGFPGFGVEVVPLLEQLTGRDLQLGLWVLLGAVGFVLLIACANVANLVLARGTARSREFAIRAALGAGRARLVRQLAVESMMLALGAGLVGTAVAVGGIRVLVASALPGIPRLNEISVDGGVLAFTAAVSILAGLLFGLVPAWKVSQTRHGDSLKETTATASGGLRVRQMRGLLVIGECALAVVLLAGAGLLVRSLARLQAVDPGFNPAGVLLTRIDLPIPVGPGWRELEWATFREITDRIRRLPGVQQTGFIQNFLIASNPSTPVTVEGRPPADDELRRLAVNVEDVTPGFFQAMGVPLRQGRFFTADEQNAPVAIINESFARRFFPGEDPLGRRFSQGEAGSKMFWQTIVGVVGNMHRQGLERQPIPEFFIPGTEPAMDLAVRVAGNPVTIATAIRHEIRQAYAPAIIVRMTTMDAFMGEWSAERRFQTGLLAVFAMLALALAVIGIYGIVQFAVAQRTREMGIRVALGAAGPDLLRLVIGQGLRLTTIGVGIGLLGAFALTRVLSHSLFEVSPTDPLTFAGVAAVLIFAALIACYLPARRAARVDPVVTLKCE